MQGIVEMFAAVPTFVYGLLTLVIHISAILFVYFSTKYRNGRHRPLYYVLTVLFPLIGVIVFAIKRKEMNGADMNVCPSCGRNYPKEFVTCYHCNIELPPYSEKKKNTQRTLALVMAVIFCTCYAIDLVSGAVMGASAGMNFVKYMFSDEDIWSSDDIWGNDDRRDDDDNSGRIGFKDENGKKVYYDREGNSYADADDVVLYTKEGEQYVYDDDTYRFRNSKGKTVSEYVAYVDSDGYFVIDKNDKIYMHHDDNDDFSTFYVDNYRYYDDKYYDDDGNVYYSATDASWTADGKLITDDATAGVKR